MKHIGVYPGTFDPITNGHTDIIVRAAWPIDHLEVEVESPINTLLTLTAGAGPRGQIPGQCAYLKNPRKSVSQMIFKSRPTDQLPM